jgi:hypothetical protein
MVEREREPGTDSTGWSKKKPPMSAWDYRVAPSTACGFGKGKQFSQVRWQLPTDGPGGRSQ